jgi:hypothetical protein
MAGEAQRAVLWVAYTLTTVVSGALALGLLLLIYPCPQHILIWLPRL